MKRLILGSVSVLLISVTAVPAAIARDAAPKSVTVNSASRSDLTPFNLVVLAHRGYFQEQGIPSYVALASAYRMRQITGEDIVRAAVEANQLAPEVLTDSAYLRAVESQLTGIESIR